MSGVIYDSQFDDEHRILRNKLGFTNPSQLEPAIAQLSYIRVMELNETPLRGKFDTPHLRAIHRYIFQDIFPWAGDFREVTTSRTNSFGFPPPQFIAPSLENIFTSLRAENHLKHLDSDRFSLRAGHYLGEINAVHAFREGNGRAQREFIRNLALTAGHRLVWTGLTPDENNHASRISYATGDSSALTTLIRKRLL
ncbi:Fic family protein [Granulicella mallensis]|uniref:protein adenylyltransferase n=1 Tax=Granulicella mallensis TaxID=940614 RepID=A0A7W8E8E1_9BACT|nr:Fic family protein [Granulicella mallensis]MBB5062717.1 cell filamentation protein [Granulicella mallensis]